MRRFALCFVLLSAGSTACDGEPFEPRAIAGDYGLVQANGESLPYFLPPVPGNVVGCDRWLVAGALSMDVAGTYAMVLHYREQCTQDSPINDYETSSAGSYTLSGQSLTFSLDGQIPSSFAGSLSGETEILLIYQSARHELELMYQRSDSS